MDHPAQPAVAAFGELVRALIEAQRVARLATIDANDQHARARATLGARYRRRRAINLDGRPVVHFTRERAARWRPSHWGIAGIEA